MPDPINPAIPAAPADEAQEEVLSRPEGDDLVKKMTHEVDTDDMFGSTT